MSTSRSNGNLYHPIRKLWKEAHPFQTAKAADEKFQMFWSANKYIRDHLLQKQNELQLKVRSRGSTILKSFAAIKTKPPESPPVENACEENQELRSLPTTVVGTEEKEVEESAPTFSVRRKAPAQEKLQSEIVINLQRIESMSAANTAGLLSDEQTKELKHLRKVVASTNLKVKRLKSCQRASKKMRKRTRDVLKRAKDSNPDEFSTYELQNESGRPPLERQYPDLLDTIIRITTAHCAADGRRRTENLRCMRTLDDLLFELQNMGFNISRSGLYLRLLPRNCITTEGKRHTRTVPVKLIRPQNTLRKPHDDSHFAAATIKYLKDAATIFGSESVFVLSQDDKARIPLGLPAANKQGPILMKMDYKVTLPDHDWVVATRHKLIPSVYAALEIKENGVSYSGPTFIAIRSGKHDSSTAFTHARDLEKLIGLNSFKDFCRTRSGECKPIWIIFVDGGPDENPRFPKTLKFAVQHFKSNNLDAIFIATHAPHQSASNPVERRMAPLSKDLCGLILPHESYGSHLDSNGRTIDDELEIKNFEKAGQILAEVWSQRIIDNFEIDAEYVSPARSVDPSNQMNSYLVETELEWMTESWKSRHVRQSQYLLQIMKCENKGCCGEQRTNLKRFLGGRFLPAPIKFQKLETGLVRAPVECSRSSFLDLSTRLCLSFSIPPLPFDHYCPSVTLKLPERTCQICFIGFSSKKAFIGHKVIHRNEAVDKEGDDATSYDDDEQDPEASEANFADNTNEIYQIQNMSSWLKSPFIEDESF